LSTFAVAAEVPAETFAGGLSVIVNVTVLEPLTVMVGVTRAMSVLEDRGFTVCVADPAAVLSMKAPALSEWYAAVIVCEPIPRTDVTKVAVPVPLTVALPINAPPSKNETVPVGTLAGVMSSVTVAVNVAAWPSVVGVVGPNVVVVLSWATLKPVVAQIKRNKKSRERNLPDGVDRAIEVTFVWTAAVRTPRKRSSNLLTGWRRSARHCHAERTKVSIKNRHFRLWKTVLKLLTVSM